VEVDFVVELPSGKVLPIEVKATRTPGFADTRGLQAFIAEYQDIAIGGLLIHGGSDVIRVTRDIVAVPWWQVM
jgi:predicted AAA+ superfamily ATPase